MEKTVYSLCFMCSVRCPIQVTVKDGQVTFIQGNPKVPDRGQPLPARRGGNRAALRRAAAAVADDPHRRARRGLLA